jgi:hypothetical protein
VENASRLRGRTEVRLKRFLLTKGGMMAKFDKYPWTAELFTVADSMTGEERTRQEFLIKLYSAIETRLEPPPEEKAWLWCEGIRVTDHADGTTSTIPCWTSRFEYEAWHRVRWPGSYPVF